MSLRPVARRRALIVNCYADETRREVRRAGKVPQSLGPAFLAGAFHPERWELHLHNEHVHGLVRDAALLSSCDVIVLTGLTTAIDRMRQVAAYARTANPGVTIIGGGHVPRALPALAATFLDISCQGDADSLAAVLDAEFGPGHGAEHFAPRIDLVDWMGRIGYAESTKYCNFHCGFCVLSGERRRFSAHPLDDFCAQLRAVGRRDYVIFIDNNFYGSDRRGFDARLEIVAEQWRAGQFKGWAALVTADFFAKPENLAKVKAAGCIGLFSGVESFDPQWNALVDKRQNLGADPADRIRAVLDHGMIFEYGIILDIYERTLADLRSEIDTIVAHGDITMPAFLSLPIPYPGTPYFDQLVARGGLLPATKIRDLDSTTICATPRDPMAEVSRFVHDLQVMRGWRGRLLAQAARFAWHRRHTLSRDQLFMGVSANILMMAPLLGTLPTSIGRRAARRTHVSSSEPLDAWYTPYLPVADRYRDAFRPVMLTDGNGALHGDVAPDLVARVTPPARVLSPVVGLPTVDA